jgi:PKD domain
MKYLAFIFFFLLSFANLAQDMNLFVVEPLSFCSKSFDEYNLVPHKKGGFLVSNNVGGTMKQVKDLQNNNLSSIFYQSNLKSRFASVNKIDLNMNFHIGSFCLNEDNDCLVFTAQKSAEDLTLGLFISWKKRATWSKPRLIFSGYDKMNLMDPFMTPTGDTLFFVANMPGGEGGTDIYMAVGKIGMWQTINSLENNVNTSFNERYPKFYKNTLYYSSTRVYGNGGLDIYSVRLTERGFISSPFHFPSPVNSENDDFAYYPIDEETGYFSSNRNGNDDIFRLKVNFPQFECQPYVPSARCFEFSEDGENTTDTTLYQFEWKFSDGSVYQGEVANHCFADTGNYIIELNLIDKATEEIYNNVASYEIEVLHTPQIEFDLPERIARGSILKLSVAKKNIKDDVTYYWDFGDGNYGQGREVSHVFNRTGQFQISLGEVKMVDGVAVKTCTSRIIYVTP